MGCSIFVLNALPQQKPILTGQTDCAILAIVGGQVPNSTQSESAAESRPDVSWAAFLRRLAFWRKPKLDMDKLFTQAVNELHPQWKKKRELKRASQVKG
jgi:hypothetical protein